MINKYWTIRESYNLFINHGCISVTSRSTHFRFRGEDQECEKQESRLKKKLRNSNCILIEPSTTAIRLIKYGARVNALAIECPTSALYLRCKNISTREWAQENEINITCIHTFAELACQLTVHARLHVLPTRADRKPWHSCMNQSNYQPRRFLAACRNSRAFRSLYVIILLSFCAPI